MKQQDLIETAKEKMGTSSDAGELGATMRRFTFEEADLQPVRKALYSPEGDGYYLVRGFAPPEYAHHMRKVWTGGEPEIWGEFAQLRNKERYPIGDGPFASHFKGKDTYYFAPWNKPVDEVTLAFYTAAVQLRNQIEQQPIFRDILPLGPYLSFYMVALSTDSEENEVEWHEDIFDHDASLPHVETRLQATLFLSEYEKDYTGTGMRLCTNTGEEVQVDSSLRPGSWRLTFLALRK